MAARMVTSSSSWSSRAAEGCEGVAGGSCRCNLLDQHDQPLHMAASSCTLNRVRCQWRAVLLREHGCLCSGAEHPVEECWCLVLFLRYIAHNHK